MSCNHSHIAVLSPIRDAQPFTSEQTESLLSEFDQARWRSIERHFLRFVPTLHMCRFQIIHHLVPGMGHETLADRLQSRYLLFIAEVDGREDDFYDHLFHQLPNRVVDPMHGAPAPAPAGVLVRDIWKHCAGYPAIDAAYLFRRFMHRYEVPASVEYAGVDACLPEILQALCVKELTAALIALDSLPSSPGSLDSFPQYLHLITLIKQMPFADLLLVYDLLFGDGAAPDFSHIAPQVMNI